MCRLQSTRPVKALMLISSVVVQVLGFNFPRPDARGYSWLGRLVARVAYSCCGRVLHFSWNWTCFFESTSIVLFVFSIYTDGHSCHILTTLPQVDIWRPQVLLQEDVSVRYIFCFSLQQFQCMSSLRIYSILVDISRY